MKQKNVPLSKDILSLGWGFIDETYNPGIITQLVEKTIKNKGFEILQYNDSLGLKELREYGKNFLEEKFSIKNIDIEQIMITNGATAGIDLVSRFILEQGKYNSVVFSPVYDTALESLKRNSKKVFSLKLNLYNKNNDLFDFIELEKILKDENIKLLYLNTNFQNPTGVIFNEEIKQKIYNLAISNGIIILEDDPYKLYNFDNIDLGENIINLDKNKENVIYLNSISKVFFPGLRIGFLVGNKKYINGISELQKYSTSSPNLIMQGATIEAFKNGEINKSIEYYKEKILEKRKLILKSLKNKGLIGGNSPIIFSESKGGFYLWGKFKNGIDTDILSKKALKYGVSFVPGNIYGNEKEFNDSFRIAYAQININDIEKAINRLNILINNEI